MMDVTYRPPGGMFEVKVRIERMQDLFSMLGPVQELFGFMDQGCGCCAGMDVRFSHRRYEDIDFYELTCASPDCGAGFKWKPCIPPRDRGSHRTDSKREGRAGPRDHRCSRRV